MKSISIKKRDLAEAIAYQTHVDFDPHEWSWQVQFSPRAQDPEAHVVFLDHDADIAAPFFADEQPFDIMAFTELDGDFHWGDPGTLDVGQQGDGKGLEAICIPDDVRGQIERSLRKQVQLGSNTYTVRFF